MRYADGELERLGIVNIDPYDLNGQSKLYARFINKNLLDTDLHSFFSEFGSIEELYTFKDENDPNIFTWCDGDQHMYATDKCIALAGSR